ALDVTSPPEAVSAVIQVSTGSGVFYLDDVQFDGPPPLPATATPAATETPSAEPSSTATPAPSGTATPSRVPSATPSAVPSATPTAGPGSSLVNGGFEDADDGVPTGWLKYGGKLSQTAEHYRSGGHSGAFRSDTESTKWAYQALAAFGGSAYEFDAYVLLDDPGAREVFLRISWYESDDAGGSAIAVSDSPARLSGNDSSFRYLTTGAALAPQSARTARLRVMLVPASSATTTVYLDDASVRQVAPELAATPAPPPAAQDDLEEVAGTIDEPARSQRGLAVTAARSLPRQGESPYAVKVNEVTYDPVQPGDEAAFEWLELYNAGGEPVDLAGWTLIDNSESDELPPLVLGTRSYIVVAASELFRDGHPLVDSPIAVIEDGRIGSGLANKGDHVLLFDPSGRLADGVSWGDDESVLSPAVAAVAPGHSIERSSPGRDTDTAADFVDNGNPSPGRGIGETAVAGAAIERQVLGSSTMSPPERAALEGSSDVRQRLIASLAAGFVALAAGLSVGAYWRQRLSPWP
ncbi:MAG: lamin tail domain-containing protein, partial [Dehalococcoidia bacterium]|nr:lamin tail domain-containing protein [Dehalococcoidia bacterium]